MGPGEMSNEQERDPEGRPQASRQNSVENSGPSGGRGGRDSTSPASSPGNLTERYWDWEGDWLKCSNRLEFSNLPGEWVDRATREDVFKLPFIASRLENGCLDASSAEEAWNHHLGDEPYADREDFYFFRRAIIENNETSRKEQDPERRCPASRQNSFENSGPSGGRGGRESTSPASSPGNLTERYWDWESDWLKCSSSTNKLPG